MSHTETIFNRALRHSLSRKKTFYTFFPLLFCGLLVVLCRALSVQGSNWVAFSLTFLPIFLCFGLLMATGAFLVRVYCEEISGRYIEIKSLLKNSGSLMIGVSYLVIPMIATYLLLWVLLGVFYLMKEIPGIGEAFSIIFSFGPFLLVLGCLLLTLMAFFLLFFLTPQIAVKRDFTLRTLLPICRTMQENAFWHMRHFALAALPLLAIVGLLSLAGAVTGATFIQSKAPLSIALQWFFIMIPFVALLTPAVIFFFNFAAESAIALERQKQEAR